MICIRLLITVLAVLYLCGAGSDIEDYRRCFDVLGVSPMDSVAAIKSKYRQLALIYHPDRLNAQIKTLDEPLRTMEEINEAYDCVLRSYTSGEAEAPHETEIPFALSERATYLVEQGYSMWESIPEIRRGDFVAEVKEYFGSEDLPGDVMFLVGKYWSKNDTEALQILARTVLLVLVANCVACTVGIATVTYFAFKFLLWVVRYVVTVFRFLFLSHKAKVD